MLHVHAASHPKFARLTDSEWRATIGGVFPLAAMSPLRGKLLVGMQPVEPCDVAHHARVSVRTAKSAMEKLRLSGVIVPDDDLGCECVHDFDDWNPAPKTDNTNAERQARHRAKLKAEADARRNGPCNAVTNGEVTPIEVGREVEELPPQPPASGGSDVPANSRAHGTNPRALRVAEVQAEAVKGIRPATAEDDALLEPIVAEVKQRIEESTWHLWLATLKVGGVSLEDGTLVLTLSEQFRSFATERYGPLFVSAAEKHDTPIWFATAEESEALAAVPLVGVQQRKDAAA